MVFSVADPDRSQVALMGAHALHGSHDSRKTSAPGRAAAFAKFEDQARAKAAERGEEISESEVTRRAGHLQKAHMARLALLSAKARRKKGAAK